MNWEVVMRAAGRVTGKAGTEPVAPGVSKHIFRTPRSCLPPDASHTGPVALRKIYAVVTRLQTQNVAGKVRSIQCLQVRRVHETFLHVA
jgi:hypothetical protein